MADVVVPREPARITYAQTYIEWAPVIAGAVLAGALSFVLFTFGAAIGLSLLSPYPGHSYGRLASSLAALWGLVVPIGSLLIGGYIAGRMRAPREAADEAETEFRDGLHGALVWGISILIGALLAFFAAGVAGQSGLAKANTAGGLVSSAADMLFAPISTAEAAPVTTSPSVAAKPSPASPTTSKNVDEDASAERIIAAGVAAGHLAPNQKSYLVGLVTQRTGMNAADAERRVDQTFAEARHAVDEARRATIAAALVTATGLMLALAAAWYAAQRGGHHRDQNIPARFTWAFRPRDGSIIGKPK